jgi:hypothetical protein
MRKFLPAFAIVAVAACDPNDALDPRQEAPFPDPPPGAVAVQFALIDEAHTTFISGIPDARRDVIRTQEEWEAFWDEFQANRLPQTDPPAVDFSTQMVIVATMGTRNTGGYEITVEDMFDDAGTLIVQVLQASPGGGCLTTQALTAPATAVAVSAVDGDPEFVEADLMRDC